MIMMRYRFPALLNYHGMVLALIIALMLMLSACSGNDNLLGGKNSPDEFEVVIRPPLTLPPNFSLRPGCKTIFRYDG